MTTHQGKPHQHPVLEFIHRGHEPLEYADHRLGQVDLGRVAVQMVAGGRAFRRYQALSNVIVQNKAGNLRGMVVSAKWNSIFRHIDEESASGKFLSNLGYLAAISAELAAQAPKLEKIIDSSDTVTLKAAQIASTAGTIAQRALLGAVPAGAHMIYRSLEGWCMIAGLAGGKAQVASTQAISTLQYADRLVKTTFQTITETENQSKAVWWVIDVVTSPRKK